VASGTTAFSVRNRFQNGISLQCTINILTQETRETETKNWSITA